MKPSPLKSSFKKPTSDAFLTYAGFPDTDTYFYGKKCTTPATPEVKVKKLMAAPRE